MREILSGKGGIWRVIRGKGVKRDVLVSWEAIISREEPVFNLPKGVIGNNSLREGFSDIVEELVVLLLLVCGRQNGMNGIIWGHEASRGVLSMSRKSGDFAAHQKQSRSAC